MKVLLDTGILIQHLRGNPAAADFLNRQQEINSIYLCTITITEILVGVRSERHYQAAKELLELFHYVSITPGVAERAAFFIKKYPHLFGKEISRGAADAFILACAWEEEAVFYSLNTRHFAQAKIEEVQIRVLEMGAKKWG